MENEPYIQTVHPNVTLLSVVPTNYRDRSQRVCKALLGSGSDKDVWLRLSEIVLNFKVKSFCGIWWKEK